ncbi:carboxypeptidase-like regulatory domain-containing protein, partial [Methanococcus maripaludis]
MRFKNIFLILLSLMLLSLSITAVSAEEIEYKFISNTTSDESGNFVFNDVPNGNYTLSGVIWSTAMGGMWLTDVEEIEIENGSPVGNLSMAMRSNSSNDAEAILRMLNRTTISGATVSKTGSAKVGTTLVLTDENGDFVTNTTSDATGNFSIGNIQNGNYTLSGVIWSTAMGGMWLTDVEEIEIENGSPVGNLSMAMR